MFQLNKDHDAASSIFVQPLSWNPAVFFEGVELLLEALLSKTLAV